MSKVLLTVLVAQSEPLLLTNFTHYSLPIIQHLLSGAVHYDFTCDWYF
jgi:hypothetical protein